MTLVIGAGRMGKRYQAILRYLKQDFDTFDSAVDGDESLWPKIYKAERFIVSTPTETHVEICKLLLRTVPLKNILCEKPISKSLSEVVDVFEKASAHKNLFMVDQYRYCTGDKVKAKYSYYDYYNHGSDGLVWDCLQIVGLNDEGNSIRLTERSPFWQCLINGETLDINTMDWAYIKMIEEFISNRKTYDPDWIFRAHQRCYSFNLIYESQDTKGNFTWRA